MSLVGKGAKPGIWGHRHREKEIWEKESSFPHLNFSQVIIKLSWPTKEVLPSEGWIIKIHSLLTCKHDNLISLHSWDENLIEHRFKITIILRQRGVKLYYQLSDNFYNLSWFVSVIIGFSHTRVRCATLKPCCDVGTYPSDKKKGRKQEIIFRY